jgi:hypothetical protein
MNNFQKTASLPLSVVGILLLIWTDSALAQHEPRPKPAPLAAWQTDINRFESQLRRLVAKARVPERKSLERRLREKSSDLEVITDGYGGVVDFNAAKDTVQYVANEMVEGRPIDWEFELAKDAKQGYDRSIILVPKFATKPKGEMKKQDIPLLAGISVNESKAGPFNAGDRVRLKASIDDFSRFRKNFRLATGLAAIYYLDDAPTSIFQLQLEKAEINLVKSTK